MYVRLGKSFYCYVSGLRLFYVAFHLCLHTGVARQLAEMLIARQFEAARLPTRPRLHTASYDPRLLLPTVTGHLDRLLGRAGMDLGRNRVFSYRVSDPTRKSSRCIVRRGASASHSDRSLGSSWGRAGMDLGRNRVFSYRDMEINMLHRTTRGFCFPQ